MHSTTLHVRKLLKLFSRRGRGTEPQCLVGARMWSQQQVIPKPHLKGENKTSSQEKMSEKRLPSWSSLCDRSASLVIMHFHDFINSFCPSFRDKWQQTNRVHFTKRYITPSPPFFMSCNTSSSHTWWAGYPSQFSSSHEFRPPFWWSEREREAIAQHQQEQRVTFKHSFVHSRQQMKTAPSHGA